MPVEPIRPVFLLERQQDLRNVLSTITGQTAELISSLSHPRYAFAYGDSHDDIFILW